MAEALESHSGGLLSMFAQGALAGARGEETPGAQEVQEAHELSLELIDPNVHQSRQVFDPVGLEELAESIRQHGVLEPILVRPVDSRFQIVAGERRYRASVIAEQNSIPVRVMQLDDTEAAIVTALENLQREDLDIEDEARQFAYLLRVTGLSQRKLAEKLGVHFNYLSRRVRLLKRPDLLQEYRSGRQTLHQVIALVDAGKERDAADTVSERLEAAGIFLSSPSEGGDTSQLPVSAGYSPEDVEVGDREFDLIEREDFPGFIVSRGYNMQSDSTGPHRAGDERQGRPGRRGSGRFRWRPVQQFYSWVGRTQVTDVPPDERATLQVQLTAIKEALEKQIAQLVHLQSEGAGGSEERPEPSSTAASGEPI